MSNLTERLYAEPHGAEVQSLVTRLAEEYDIPSDSAFMLGGSISQGLGNAKSDIDIFVLSKNDEEIRGPLIQFFLDDQRVEIFRISTGDMKRLREDFDRAFLSGDLSNKTDRDVAHLCQQLSKSVILRSNDFVENEIKKFRSNDIDQYRCNFLEKNLVYTLWRAGICVAYQDDPCAARLYRTSARLALQLWVSRRGFTYWTDKFSENLARRALLDADLLEDVSRLSRGVGEVAYGDQCLSFIDKLSLNIKVPSIVRVSPLNDMVSDFKIKENTYVTRYGSNSTFILDGNAQALWQLLREHGEFDVDMNLERSRLMEILPLHAAGLIELGCPAGGAPAWQYPRTSGELRPGEMIGLSQIICDTRSFDMRKLSINNEIMLSCCSNLVSLNMLFDNSLEDFDGAVQSENWPLAEFAIRQHAVVMGKMLLAGLAFHPLPEDEFVLPIVARLDGFSVVSCGLMELERMRIHSADSAALAERVAKDVYGSLPDPLKEAKLRGSHDNRDAETEFRKVLEWIRVGRRQGVVNAHTSEWWQNRNKNSQRQSA